MILEFIFLVNIIRYEKIQIIHCFINVFKYYEWFYFHIVTYNNILFLKHLRISFSSLSFQSCDKHMKYKVRKNNRGVQQLCIKTCNHTQCHSTLFYKHD